jgi:hypothetical protein
LGPTQYSAEIAAAQEAASTAHPFRCRHCLLKGCEQFYRPIHPLSRYCSEVCRVAAKRWRRRLASRTWRSSERGKTLRREQCKRYRRRIPLVLLCVCEVPPVQAERSAPIEASTQSLFSTPAEPPRCACEGQRKDEIPENSSLEMCQRPGCYEAFIIRPGYSPKRFCCSLCRRALRNVLDREAQYRRRRRKGSRLRCRNARPPPETGR